MPGTRLVCFLAAVACIVGGAIPAGADDAAALRALDRRADGSPILRLVVPDAPRAAPPVAFLDEDGRKRSLADYRGTPVAVHFWATWCFPCREEMPRIDALQRLLGEAVAVLPLSVGRDAVGALRAYYEEHGLRTLPVAIDERMKAARALKVNGIPTTVFIDDSGREIARVIGERDWDDPAVAGLVRRLVE